jgi:hypothetical protein
MNYFHRLLFTSIATGLVVLASVCAYAESTDNDNDMVADNSIDHTPTYNLYDDVDLVSTLKFQYGKPRLVIKSVYPQLASDTDNDGVNNFNDMVTQLVQTEISSFEDNIKMNSPTQKVATKSKGNNNLYIDYDTSYLRANKDHHIVSVRFSTQGYINNLAHPYHNHHVINYNINTAQTIELADLFQPNSNYLETLSGYCSQVLNKRLSNKEMISNGTAPTPENYAIWNIKANGILITFDEYKVAPYIDGAQTVLVPYSFLADIIAPESAIAPCINHKKRCASNNLLTGGFIDEADATPMNKRGEMLHLA